MEPSATRFPGFGSAALGLTAGLFGRGMKGWRGGAELHLDPMGFWILKDICSIGPRLLLEGLRQIRFCAELGDLNVAACARALAYLAGQSSAVSWEDLIQHCPHLPSERLRAQLSLLDGVLFLGDDASRVILMDPFRLRLRGMLKEKQSAGTGRESARPRPQTPPRTVPVNQPEMLSAYEILGLPPSASVIQIKSAYRKRIKECHPDLFAGMDQQAKALAERWTKALNAAYATLNPRKKVVLGITPSLPSVAIRLRTTAGFSSRPPLPAVPVASLLAPLTPVQIPFVEIPAILSRARAAVVRFVCLCESGPISLPSSSPFSALFEFFAVKTLGAFPPSLFNRRYGLETPYSLAWHGRYGSGTAAPNAKKPVNIGLARRYG